MHRYPFPLIVFSCAGCQIVKENMVQNYSNEMVEISLWQERSDLGWELKPVDGVSPILVGPEMSCKIEHDVFFDTFMRLHFTESNLDIQVSLSPEDQNLISVFKRNSLPLIQIDDDIPRLMDDKAQESSCVPLSEFKLNHIPWSELSNKLTQPAAKVPSD